MANQSSKIHRCQKSASIKSAHAMLKVLIVQNCDDDILEGLVVVDTPLFFKSKIHCFLVGRRRL